MKKVFGKKIANFNSVILKAEKLVKSYKKQGEQLCLRCTQ